MDDPAELRRSVRNLLELEFDVLLFGDGTPILAGARTRLAELVETFPHWAGRRPSRSALIGNTRRLPPNSTHSPS
jgi:uncharacterized protein YjiS (DUF1127 family)